MKAVSTLVGSLSAIAALVIGCNASGQYLDRLEVDDVVISPDWTTGAAREMMIDLGIPCPQTDSAGFSATGSLGSTLTFECVANDSLLGQQVQVRVSNSVVLANTTQSLVDANGQVIGNSVYSTVLFYGSIGNSTTRTPVLAIATTCSATLDANPTATLTATNVQPIGEAITPALATAYVNQVKEWREVAAQPPGGTTVDCIPVCLCTCDALHKECQHLCANAFFACCLGVFIGADLVFLGTCVVGCAATGPAAPACFTLCTQLVGKAALAAMAECTAYVAACYLGCQIGANACEQFCEN
jgi:hypothetical protein